MSIPNLDLSTISVERRNRVIELVDKAIKSFPMAENTLRTIAGGGPGEHDLRGDGIPDRGVVDDVVNTN